MEKWNKTDQNESTKNFCDETILQIESELEFVAKLQPKTPEVFASWGVFRKWKTCEIQKLKVVTCEVKMQKLEKIECPSFLR